MHLKKVTTAKKIRLETIIHLSDFEFTAALTFLGEGFEYPSEARLSMLLREVFHARDSALKANAGSTRQGKWKELATMLLPGVGEDDTSPFVPTQPRLANCNLQSGHALRRMKAELVEGTLLPLISASTSGVTSPVYDFCHGVLAAFENLWVDFDEMTTKNISMFVACCRALQMLCTMEELIDDDSFVDLRLVQEGGTASENKSIKAMVGAAMLTLEFFADRLSRMLKSQNTLSSPNPSSRS